MDIKKLKVLTPDGYKPFDGIRKQQKDEYLLLNLCGNILKCSTDHLIKTSIGFVEAKKINHKHRIKIANSFCKLTNIKLIKESIAVFDLLEVGDTHEYFTNGIVSHNCEFLSSDSLLFNSILLQAMRSENPIAEELGFKFWREFKTNTTYLVGADIGTGSELDFSVINVVDLETMEQVAEFRSNTINTNQLYSAIKWIMNKIINDTRENIGKIPDIYWSFENNGVGQAISALFYNDEKAPEAILLSTNDKKPGFVTTGKNKIVSCMQFKKAVEGKVKPLKIKSKFLIEEMKNFVGNKTSYAAKEGATDDSIASMLVIMQMLNKAAEFNDSAHSMVYDYSDTIENAFEDDISDTDVPAFVF